MVVLIARMAILTLMCTSVFVADNVGCDLGDCANLLCTI